MLLFLFILLVSSQPQQPNTTTLTTIIQEIVGQDFIQCIEKNECGIQSVCGFQFHKLHFKSSNEKNGNDPGIDPCKKEKLATDVAELCKPIISGYLYLIKNNMDYPITFYWNVLDRPEIDDQTLRLDGYTLVPAHSLRYFTNSLTKTHTVRLFVGNEFVDEALGLSQKKCSDGDVCDLLFRFCYQARKQAQLPSSSNLLPINTGPYEKSTSNDLELCKMYDRECEEFSKRNDEREKDFTIFLQTHFKSLSSSLLDTNGGGGKIQSSNIAECVFDAPDYQRFKEQNGNLIGPHSDDDDDSTSDAGFITAIVLLSVLIVVMIVVIICLVPYCATPVSYVKKWVGYSHSPSGEEVQSSEKVMDKQISGNTTKNRFSWLVKSKQTKQ